MSAASGVSSKTVDVRKISLLQIWMLVENLVLAHSGAQPAEHVPYSNATSPERRVPLRAYPARL